MGSLKFISIFLALGGAKLDAVFQLLFNDCCVKGKIASLDQMAILLLFHTRMLLGFIPAKACCWVIFILLSTRTLGSMQKGCSLSAFFPNFILKLGTESFSRLKNGNTELGTGLSTRSCSEKSCCLWLYSPFLVLHSHHRPGTRKWDLRGHLHSDTRTPLPSLLTSGGSTLCFLV